MKQAKMEKRKPRPAISTRLDNKQQVGPATCLAEAESVGPSISAGRRSANPRQDATSCYSEFLTAPMLSEHPKCGRAFVTGSAY